MDTHLSNCAVRTFRVAGVTVDVRSERPADLALIPAMSPFCCTTGPDSDINIRIEWAPCLERKPEISRFDSGAVWRMYDDGAGFVFDFLSSIFGDSPYKRLFVDREFRKADLQMNSQCFADGFYDACPLEYPLDELLIMHRLTKKKAIELHGTGIVRSNGEANLFVGHSGAGKSTTTRLWTEREQVEVLSDDRIIVRRDEEASVMQIPCEAAGCASQQRVLRLDDRSASPPGHSAQDDKGKRPAIHKGLTMRMYGTPWHGEAMYASPNSAPLTRIFVLEHGLGNVITPLTPSHAVAELFARSFVPFHRHEYVDSALAFLEELANAVPVYRYAFEPDQHAVEKIRNFHD